MMDLSLYKTKLTHLKIVKRHVFNLQMSNLNILPVIFKITHIQSINNIVCVNEDKTIMGKVIEDYNDKQLLKKIMMMPFVSTGGKRKTIKKYENE